MKDIVITPKQIKKELLVLLVCFVLSFIINIVAIVVYKTSWIEVFSQIGYVIIISVVLYILISLVRLIVSGIKKLFKSK